MKKYFLFLFLCFSLCLQANQERFPQPDPKEVEKEEQLINELGKDEIFSLSYFDIADFLWDRYVSGPGDDFHNHGCNPKKLSPEKAKRPATILLHACSSNQGQWNPLLSSIQNYGKKHPCGPVFSFNYEQETDLAQLINKIEKVRDLYLAAGESTVEINLVGHSLGGICSAEYAFNPKLWVENTTVKKVISIAGRLKNIEPPTETPYYSYCYDVLERIDHIWDKIEENRGIVELYTIAGADDWLVPIESLLVGDDADHMAMIPGKGHVLIARSQETFDLVIKWLFETP